MAKRYYYTCPLKAAWMMREHGICFIYSTNLLPVLNWFEMIDCYNSVGENYTHLAIDESSIPLLLPQVGDLVQIYEEDSSCYYCGMSWLKLFKDKEDIDLYTSVVQIIQRNGKAFFAPFS